MHGRMVEIYAQPQGEVECIGHRLLLHVNLTIVLLKRFSGVWIMGR